MGFIKKFGLWTEEQQEAARAVLARVGAEGLRTIRVSFVDQHGILCHCVIAMVELSGLANQLAALSLLLVGKTLVVNHVRNHFPLDTADSYLLIAGGIGVTPLVPMARELAARGADWSAVYCGHGAHTMAFREELTRVGGDRVSFVDTTVAPRPDLKELIGALAPGAVVYCCGPAGLLDAVTEICEAAGVRCETEHFSAATPDPDAAPGDEVELELRESGITVVADADTTLLQAIRDAGLDLESDCEEGYCGTCETRVLEGTPDHRDVVLSKAERAAGKTFFPCVSRACGRKLVLDL
ncbi:PDR/VanB family oxidoreductase [Amycolatopsis sp. NPDC023774]|uniref:PDR/VanB family oxidoreductase n=1 Tax=Amycolatopsis sp. NPDC023774 TaxID=3155015 RepID=UPI0033ED18B8